MLVMTLFGFALRLTHQAVLKLTNIRGGVFRHEYKEEL